MTLYDDELDLRPMAQLLASNWRPILWISLGLALTGLVITLALPKAYDARAALLLTRSRVNLELADQFPTVSEPIDSGSRMDAILTIANSTSIAFQVFSQVEDQLPAGEREVAALEDMVSITSVGDAVIIAVRSPEPELSARIANAWANEASVAINLGYKEDLPLSDIQGQISAAETEYREKQLSLEEFLTDNDLARLQTEIDALKEILIELASGQKALIRYYRERIQAMQVLIAETEALEGQLNSTDSSNAAEIGDAIAVLQVRAFGLQTIDDTSAGLNLDLRFDDLTFLTDDPASYTADLNALSFQAEAEIGKAEQAIDELISQTGQPAMGPRLDRVSTELARLEALLEQGEARKLELLTDRDLAWQAYQALAQKESELLNAPLTGNIITLASPAVAPPEAVSRGSALVTLASAAIGGILSVTWILVRNWWQNQETPSH